MNPDPHGLETLFRTILIQIFKFSDPSKDTTLDIAGKKVTVPQGKPLNQSEFSGSNFWQSEYLVYKESQNHIRYLLKLTF